MLTALAARIVTLPEQLLRSLTWDQGKEMAQHARFTIATGLQIYICDPRSPWQRGTNENTNRLVRQFFPKGTHLASTPKHRFTRVQQLLNNRPRKCLGYRTPLEVLGSRLLFAIDT